MRSQVSVPVSSTSHGLDAGTDFAATGLEVAYSPTLCSMVQLGDDKKLRWSMLRHTDWNIGETMEDRKSH